MERDSATDVTRDVTRTSLSRSVESKSKSKETTTGLGLGTSLRAHDTLSAAALTLVTLRPDWREQAVCDVLAADPRPWRVVIAAALTCALDPRIEHPAAITTSNPGRSSEPTPVPPPIAEVRAPLRTCDHGGIEGRCPSCRTTWRTEVVA